MVRKFVSVCSFLAVPAAAAFDGATLVQRSVEGHAAGAEGLFKTQAKAALQPRRKGAQPPAMMETLMKVATAPTKKVAHVCTAKETEKFESQMAEFQQQQKAWEEERRKLLEAAAAEKQAKQNKTATEFKNRMLQFVAPLQEASQSAFGIVLDAARPAAKTAFKAGVQGLLKPKTPYSDGPALSAASVMTELTGRLNSSQDQVLQLMQSAWGRLDEAVNEAAKEFPQLAAALPSSGTVPASPAELQKYLTEKAFPVFLADAFPQLGKVLPLLLKAPKDPKEVPEYFKSTVLPVLPKQCQPAKLMTDLTLGSGGMSSRVSNFIAKCRSVLMPAPGASEEEQGPPPPVAPVKKCITCKQQYQSLMTDMSVSGSCVTHCQPLLFACLKGVSDDCIHKASACLRCSKNKLQQLYKCEGTDASTPALEKLSTLTELFKTGTVEQEGVDALLDSISKVLLKDTVLDPAKAKEMWQTAFAEPEKASAEPEGAHSEPAEAPAEAKQEEQPDA